MNARRIESILMKLLWIMGNHTYRNKMDIANVQNSGKNCKQTKMQRKDIKDETYKIKLKMKKIIRYSSNGGVLVTENITFFPFYRRKQF